MNDDTGMPLRGTLFQHYETGVEGDCWAFQDDQDKSWTGFHVLKDGDELKVFSPTDPTQLVWSGVVNLHTCIKWFSIRGRRVGSTRSHQTDIDRAVWAVLFNDNYPAELIPKK